MFEILRGDSENQTHFNSSPSVLEIYNDRYSFYLCLTDNIVT
jgi:hypothetical protein